MVTSDKEKCFLFTDYFSSVFIKEPDLIEKDSHIETKKIVKLKM